MDSNLPESTIISPQLKQSAPVEKKSNKTFFIIGGVVLLLILILVGSYFFVKTKNQQPAPEVSITPTPAFVQDGAKFVLQADPVEATVGGQIKVSVLVKSDLDFANLFIAKLKFSNQLLQAKSINLRSESSSSGFIKDWFISNWVENTIDNNTGSVSLVGGVPNPGFQTQKESSGSAMADVIFEAKAPGDATISFDDTSAVYRNSDNANILVGKQPISLKIIGEVLPPVVEASPSATLAPSPTSIPSLTPSPSPSGAPISPSTYETGDVNSDGKLDLQDLSALLSAWGRDANPMADLNQDGVVNAFDYSRLVKLLKDASITL